MVTKTIQRPALLNIPAESQSLEFRRTPLSEVFAILEATYGIDIQFDQKAMAHCTLTARLSDEPVGEKLDLICAVVNARYETHDGVISVTSQGCEQPLLNHFTYGKKLHDDHSTDHENQYCPVSALGALYAAFACERPACTGDFKSAYI